VFSVVLGQRVIVVLTAAFWCLFPSVRWTQGSLFILLCPSNAHKIWVGTAFPAHEAGIEMDGDEDVPSAANVLRWAAKVLPGEARFENTVGSHLLTNEDVTVEM
jgi:hypothetical protein